MSETRPAYAGQVAEEVKPFILDSSTVVLDGPMVVESPIALIDIARVCHEANRAYCEVLGDNSGIPWAYSTVHQAVSMIEGIRFVLMNPSAQPRELHENWVENKIKDGWRMGPVKDDTKKEHPCLVPYDQLPEAQRVKDILFRSIVLAFRPFVVWP